MNLTIASITARSLVGRRRFLALLLLPLILISLTAFAGTTDTDPSDWGDDVLVGLGIAVVLPITALVVGSGALGLEIDDGTLLHILAKPLPRREIVLTKLVVAWAVVVAVAAVSLGVSGVLTDGPRLGLGVLVAGAVAALAYSALFALLSLVTRRPVFLGLLYVVLWEGLLGNVVSGTAVLSIQQYAVAIAAKISGSELFDPEVSLPVAITMSALLTVGAAALATERLRSFSVAGETG